MLNALIDSLDFILRLRTQSRMTWFFYIHVYGSSKSIRINANTSIILMNFSVYSLSLSKYYKENAKNLISKDLHVAKKKSSCLFLMK